MQDETLSNLSSLGANSGVGLAAATVIASASKTFHVLLACRSIEKAEKAKAEIEAEGNIQGTLSPLLIDVTKESSIEQAAATVEEQFGRLDILINNAGIYSQEKDRKTRFTSTFETNVLGPALVAEAFRPLLLKSSNPYSIYVSSGLGSLTRTSDPSQAAMPDAVVAYSASKSALNMVAVHEWKNWGSKGLKVFSFCPGLVVSNLRGTSEEAREARNFGGAGDPKVSGQALLKIIQGERDSDNGKFVHKDGIYGW
jgi:NAD(P)-dependent dehydrogenase (short-subunit alcohol dehydrogenase family)